MTTHRGRKSAAERATTPVVAISTQRPAPPAALTEAEGAVWRETVNSLPADWIRRAAFPVLTAYCRHVVTAELLAQQVNAFKPAWLLEEGGLERLNKLLAARDREVKGLINAARQLRLTPQSVHRQTAGRALAREPEGRRLWER